MILASFEARLTILSVLLGICRHIFLFLYSSMTLLCVVGISKIMCSVSVDCRNIIDSALIVLVIEDLIRLAWIALFSR